MILLVCLMGPSSYCCGDYMPWGTSLQDLFSTIRHCDDRSFRSAL